MSAYAFVDATSLVAASNIWRNLGTISINIETGEKTPFATPYTDFDDISSGNGQLLFVGASPALGSAIVRLDVSSGNLEGACPRQHTHD